MKGLILLICSIAFIAIVHHQEDVHIAKQQEAYAKKHKKSRKPVVESSTFLVGNASPTQNYWSKNQGIARMRVPPKPEPRKPNLYPIPKRIDFGHIEGKGIGYDRGYTKVAVVFAPEYRIGHYLSLISLRGVVFDDGKCAANASYIGRYLPKSFCEVFGFNVSYDFRQGRNGNYNQISGGLEVLNRRWDLHANGSAPVGDRRHVKRCVFDDFIGPFREVCRRREAAEYIVDGSVGYYFVNGKNFKLYASAGPYYFWGQLNISAGGGRAVLRPQFGDYLSVELSVSHDHHFKTIYQANVVFTLPLYRFSSRLKHKQGPCRTRNYQIYQPIDRDIVLVRKCCCHNNF